MVGTALKQRFRMVSTDFVQSQGLGVKKRDLYSKSGGFAPSGWRPKMNEKNSGAQPKHGIAFKLGFGEFL